MRAYRLFFVILGICGAALAFDASRASELSSDDELRAVYSDRFSFTDEGMPLVTVEIMSGQTSVTVGAARGVDLLPTGEAGAVVSGSRGWTVEVENPKPPAIHEWTVVARFDIDDDSGVDVELARWKRRRYKALRFEVGTVFGIEGEVIDSREVLIGIDPVKAGRGSKRAAKHARKWNIETTVLAELVDLPKGTIVATSSDGRTVVRSPIAMWFAPHKRNATIEVKDVVFGGGGSQLHAERTEDRDYFGSIYVTVGRDAKLVVVSAVTADKLLAGLVPSEIFPDAPTEALRAQAIAARTELLNRIGTRHFADPFLVCSSQHCQVYSGAGKEHPRTTKAVEHTRGKVLLHDSGGLVDARYSASCGGHSEHKENIWGGDPDPALRGHLDSTPSAATKRFDLGVTDKNVDQFLAAGKGDAYCGTTKYGKGRYRWKKKLDAEILSQRVVEHYPDVGRVTAIEPLERGISGRIRRVRITGTEGTAIAKGDLHLRRMFGGLRSTLFTVRSVGNKRSPDAFEFRGAGFGHGVGMCQTGAIGRAEAKHSFAKILRHYYEGSKVRRLY